MRLHRLLLRLYPKSFRDEYGAEMRRVFARRHRDAGGWLARTVLWTGEIADTVGTALRVHADIFGQDVVDHYLNAARVEQEMYDSVVHDWDRERYLERG